MAKDLGKAIKDAAIDVGGVVVAIGCAFLGVVTIVLICEAVAFLLASVAGIAGYLLLIVIVIFLCLIGFSIYNYVDQDS